MFTIIQRLLSHVRVVDSGCWETTASTTTNGYSRIWVNRKYRYGHRIIYEYFNNGIDHRLVIDHLCKNIKCVNPLHLELVTIKENTRRGTAGHHNAIKFAIKREIIAHFS